MNESFKSVFTEVEAFTEPNMTEAQEGFQEVLVQKQDVGRLIRSLVARKAMGPDGVSGWILMKFKDQLPVQQMRGGCHKSGRGPTQNTDPLNYRPVSLTSVISKICEILIKEKWVRYLEENGVTMDPRPFRGSLFAAPHTCRFFSQFFFSEFQQF